MTPRTFPDLLAERLRHDPGQPLVTMYDDATGERTELSVTTYANWVSKNANLLTEELDLEPGDTVLLDLPPHWLVTVFLGAAWTAGLSVTTNPSFAHSVRFCGPEGPSGSEGAVPIVACALRPFAVRFPDGPPAGTLDHGVLWPGQSDVFVPLGAVGPETVAVRGPEEDLVQAELIDRAHRATEPGTRLLTDLHPVTDDAIPAFLGPLATGGSLVLVRHGADDGWPARQEAERASVVLRASGQPASE